MEQKMITDEQIAKCRKALIRRTAYTYVGAGRYRENEKHDQEVAEVLEMLHEMCVARDRGASYGTIAKIIERTTGVAVDPNIISIAIRYFAPRQTNLYCVPTLQAENKTRQNRTLWQRFHDFAVGASDREIG